LVDDPGPTKVASIVSAPRLFDLTLGGNDDQSLGSQRLAQRVAALAVRPACGSIAALK
jgi:hypothetical protein